MLASKEEIVIVAEKRRSHYGKIVLTPRDLIILQWMGEQYAIRFDHLRVFAGRLAEVENRLADGSLSYQATYRIATRWVNAGLVERRKIFAGQPMWLWLTKRGIQTLGVDLLYHVPAISRLAHIQAVNAVRLHIEDRVGGKARWVCERAANTQRKTEGKKHLVDGEVEYLDGHVVAVEVELTQKRRVRLDAILSELKKDYESVWYFASKECYNAVQRAIKRVPDYDETFIMHSLFAIMDSSD